MHSAVRFFALFGLVSGMSFAENWHGMLVSSRCYQSEETNSSADATFEVGADKALAIRMCSPTARTKSFAVVDPDGLSFHLDAAGNEKAAALVPKAAKRSLVAVTVTGTLNNDTIQVQSISRQK